jgi:hypothetical protein
VNAKFVVQHKPYLIPLVAKLGNRTYLRICNAKGGPISQYGKRIGGVGNFPSQLLCDGKFGKRYLTVWNFPFLLSSLAPRSVRRCRQRERIVEREERPQREDKGREK